MSYPEGKDCDITYVQEELLYLLTQIHQMCVRHGIMYSLHGGTLLGAVREKGFISWDDDADISIMRSEYEKLKELLKHEEIEKEIKFDDTSDRIARFIMKRNNRPLVWVDVFIYDYISEKRINQILKISIIMFLLMLTRSREMMKVVKAKGKCTGWKYVIYNTISIIGSMFPNEKKLKWLNSFCQYCLTGKKEFIHRGLDQSSAIKLILPTKVMEHYRIVSFEDTELMISERYHDILELSYGSDYMIPRRFAENENAVHEMFREIEEHVLHGKT